MGTIALGVRAVAEVLAGLGLIFLTVIFFLLPVFALGCFTTRHPAIGTVFLVLFFLGVGAMERKP